LCSIQRFQNDTAVSPFDRAEAHQEREMQTYLSSVWTRYSPAGHYNTVVEAQSPASETPIVIENTIEKSTLFIVLKGEIFLLTNIKFIW
jgi:hypothetical protein